MTGFLFDPNGPELRRVEDLDEKAAKFVRFYHANPRVWQLFKRFALEAKSLDRKVGARLIWERMRWELYFTTTGQDEETGDGFKLNDHLIAYYSRLLMLTDTRFVEFFEIRRIEDFDMSDEEIIRLCGFKRQGTT